MHMVRAWAPIGSAYAPPGLWLHMAWHLPQGCTVLPYFISHCMYPSTVVQQMFTEKNLCCRPRRTADARICICKACPEREWQAFMRSPECACCYQLLEQVVRQELARLVMPREAVQRWAVVAPACAGHVIPRPAGDCNTVTSFTVESPRRISHPQL